MNTYLDCIPCFVRQGLEAARFVSDDPVDHERILRAALREAAEADLSQSPPAFAQLFHRWLRESSGVADPYRDVKERFNRMAAAMMPDLRERIAAAADPMYLALRLAVAGNVIDLGVKGGIGEGEAEGSIRRALDEPFEGDMEAFRAAVQGADSILYLADNAGEIFFDRLLIEQLPTERVVLAVRGGPVLNDATREDAEAAGLCDLVEVIDNGSDAPGTILASCSEAFRRRFAEADLILSKGQGNFETLSEEDANICFLFRVKCPVIAAHAGLPLGSHAAIRWTRQTERV